MIEILWESSLPRPYDPQAVKDFCEEAADVCGLGPGQEISLVFTTDEQICRLNGEYRNKAEPTDVLSFAFGEAEGWPADQNEGLLGEVFISTQMIGENAAYFQVDEEEELKRLIVHGFLHVLGHDHQTNNEEEPMLKKQEKILKQLAHLNLKNLEQGKQSS